MGLNREVAGSRVVVAGTLGLLILTALIVGHRISQPWDGTVIQVSNRPWHSDQLVIDRVLDASVGFRPGDVIVAVDGRPVASYAKGGLSTNWPDTALTYTVTRGDTLVDVVVTSRPFSLIGFVASSWPALAWLVALLLVASYVFTRRPLDRGARDLLLLSGLMTCGTVGWLMGDQAANLVVRGPSWWHLIEEIPLALIWGLVAHFLLVVSGRVRWTGTVSYALCMAAPVILYGAYLAVSLPTSSDAGEVAGRLIQVSLPASMILPAACAVLLVVLYATAPSGPTRQSLRLMLVTLGLGALAWIGAWTVPAMLGWNTLDSAYFPLVFLPALLALVAAIVSQRLFEVEVLITRSLIYTALTGSVLAAYAGATWGLQQAWGSTHTIGVLIFSGLLAMCLQPLSAKLSRRLSRLAFGERDDPAALARSLDGVEDHNDPGDALAQVAMLLHRSLRLTYVEILLTDAQGAPALDAHRGKPGTRSGLTTLPLANGTQTIGQLRLEVGVGREPFGKGDDTMLRTLQRQIGALATNILLSQELQQSRDRIVRAREEERRQLHHRLHDGLGASLAASSMQLEAAQYLVESDPQAAQFVLSRLSASTKELVADLRGLVYGLRPPALDQVGLAAAIRGRAEEFSLVRPSGHRLTVDVTDAGGLDGLPAAVEVAAYWIAVEATHNVVKHAQASKCHIGLSRGVALVVCVEDDGIGLPASITTGGGLRSMTERAEELGGGLTLSAGQHGHGAQVRALLPISGRVAP